MADRVIVVTGASGGIGTAIVDAFTALDDTVVGLDLVDGFDVTDLSATEPTLETVFINLTGKDLRE